MYQSFVGLSRSRSLLRLGLSSSESGTSNGRRAKDGWLALKSPCKRAEKASGVHGGSTCFGFKRKAEVRLVE